MKYLRSAFSRPSLKQCSFTAASHVNNGAQCKYSWTVLALWSTFPKSLWILRHIFHWPHEVLPSRLMESGQEKMQDAVCFVYLTAAQLCTAQTWRWCPSNFRKLFLLNIEFSFCHLEDFSHIFIRWILHLMGFFSSVYKKMNGSTRRKNVGKLISTNWYSYIFAFIIVCHWWSLFGGV